MTKIRKYSIIFKTSLLTKISYLGNVFGNTIVYVVVVFVLLRLWRYMYADANVRIVGFSLEQMLWYVSMTELIWFNSRSGFIRSEITNEIKSGKIAYTLNKPYNYMLYVLSKFFGEIIASYSLNATFAALMGLVLIGALSSFNIISLPFIIITFLLASLVSALVYLTFALSAFWFEENKPFVWIYEKFVLLVGIIFPIEIFPEHFQGFIKLSPIYTSIYAPAKMTVDFSFGGWLNMTVFQLIYVALGFAVVMFIFSKGVRKLNVNGG